MNATAKNTKQSIISVVIVVYNGENHISETIKSVADQDRSDIGLIVIDGGSTDDTVNILKENNECISYWISEKDTGIYDAMNKGWNAAQRDSYVLFLGAGDRLLSLPEDMSSFSKEDVVIGDVYLGRSKMFVSKAGFMLRLRNSLHHQALLVNKSLYPQSPFDTRFKIYADFDFNQRLMKMKANFVHSASFRSYALPGGVSARFDLSEWLGVVEKNFGKTWKLGALAYFLMRRTYVRARDFVSAKVSRCKV